MGCFLNPKGQMQLTLRRTASLNPPGSPPMFEGEDYSVLRDGKYIGRIYRTHDGRWLWAVSAFVESRRRNGLAESREAAMVAFKEALGLRPSDDDPIPPDA